MKFKPVESIALMMFGVLLLSSCRGKKTAPLITEQEEKADIEVIYFYGSQRCATCKAMEKFAQEAVDSIFPEKINNGNLSFKSIDITTPEGEKLADEFEVTSSSIFIVNNKPEYPEKVDLTAFGFRNARNNRNVYKQGIIDQINKFLD